MTKEFFEMQCQRALAYYEKVGIVLTEEEKRNIEVLDFDIGIPNDVGLQLLTYINTEKVCAKEMVLFPYQTCPQHIHVPTNGMPGKEETFRCRYGKVFLYVPGDGNPEDIQARLPGTDVNVFHEIVLCPGEQYTLLPETWHWFQAGPEGAVISEFSTRSTDETDRFIDPRLIREPIFRD